MGLPQTMPGMPANTLPPVGTTGPPMMQPPSWMTAPVPGFPGPPA
jgi:hypothetical protein